MDPGELQRLPRATRDPLWGERPAAQEGDPSLALGMTSLCGCPYPPIRPPLLGVTERATPFNRTPDTTADTR